MKIYIASDHAGFELKTHIVQYLEENGIEVVDKGPYSFNPDDDYPDWISLAAEAVSKDSQHAKAIVIGLSGQGEALVANKFKGVRSGVYYGGHEEIVKLLREHNNANVLSLGAKFISKHEAERAVDIFIENQFTGEERHVRRLQKLEVIDSKR
ncbi:MAG: RpiB/LacA/LacB family sugar-phosphate isomerase [Patescibacteria group bacterium]